jgi:hypothetical protein
VGVRTAIAVDLVRRYEMAVASGRFDDAMALRCPVARLHDIDRALWVTQARQLVAFHGVPTVTRVRIAPSVRIRPMQPLKNLTELVASIRYARGATGDIELVMGRAEGRWGLCGTATSASSIIHTIDPSPGSEPSTAATAKALVPAAPKGALVDDDRRISRRPSSTLPRAVDSWERGWRTPPYGGVRVSVERLISNAAAQQLSASWLGSAKLSDSKQIFRVPGDSRALGLRYLGLAWLWAETESVGPYIDEVQLVYGPVLVDIEVGGLATTSDHSQALALAQAVEHNARR